MTPESTLVASTQETPPNSVAPIDEMGFPWGDALTALSIVVGLVLLWTRIEKIELSGYRKGLVSFVNLGLLVVGVVSLGWLVGTVLIVGLNILLGLITLARYEMQYEDKLAHAAAVSRSTLPEMKALVPRLRQGHKVFRYIQRMDKARLVDHLSERARTINEIEPMAPAIAVLWVMERPELGKFVADFDRLMRLWGKPASDAMTVADTIAATGQFSPMTMKEVIDSLITVAERMPFRKRGPGSTVETAAT